MIMVSPSPRVTIVDTGKANLASVSAALRRAGAEPFIACTAKELVSADFLLLPGVGAFGAAMDSLLKREMVGPIRLLIEGGVPTLAICLGMQLLCSASEEASNHAGLNIFSCEVTSFSNASRTPHLGWNQVEAPKGSLVTSGYAYFAHSFRIPSAPMGCIVGVTNYDAPFVASIELRNILACQFHPELSGKWGAELIRSWIERGRTSC
jgi:glutamine amidotransferase